MADKVATYSVKVEGNAKDVGDEGADALDRLRASIGNSQSSIKDLSATLKTLRGASDEVKGAKERLKAQIEAERSAISSANLELLKSGTSYDKLTTAMKQADAAKKKLADDLKKKDLEDSAKQSAALGKGLQSMGGPVGEIAGKFDALEGIVTGSGGAMGVLAVGIGAGVAVVGLLAVAIVDLTSKFAAWVVESGNALRAQALQREAWTGSATDALHLGHQIDALAATVPLARDKLNELAGSAVKALSGTRVSGQGIVDTFAAVSTASAAMGDEVGRRFQEIIDRGKQFGRVSINPFELQGTGVSRGDVATALAKQMNVSVQAATTALAQGRVKVDDAAKAIRTAVEARFGAVNAKKMIDLNVIIQKFKDNIQGLTAGANLEGLLKGVSKLADLFSQSTVSGAALKTLVTGIANTLGPAFEKAVPIIQKAVVKIEILALRIGIAVLETRNRIKEAFGGDMPELRNLMSRVGELTPSVRGLADEFALAAKAFGTGVILAGKFAVAIERIMEAKERLGKLSWSELGKSIVEGIEHGITAAIASLKGVVGGLANAIKGAFKSALGIQSPSKVFEGYGGDTAEGYARGVEGGSSRAQGAADAMAPAPPSAGSVGAAGRSGAPISVVVNIQAGGNGGGDAAKDLGAPEFLAKLTKAIEDALIGAGLPVQAGASP